MSTSSQNTEPTTYVVMIGGLPLAAAPTLEAAQAHAEAEEARYGSTPELRWTEHRPGQWRLMSRRTGRGRFSWTQRWVLAVPTITEGGAR
ncbi:hypothetical protein ACH4LN_18150 [Streptomyces albus]|uniref:hypothetical protein n=1 Tax=Streptomyces albus TaxID=1888 RepID=UPI0037AC7936